MLNFTVGPVMMDDEIKHIGSEEIPYFRTEEFSKIMLENEELIKKFANATMDSKAVFLTGSGTASMEASICNIFTKSDKVLVVNGGSFGERFVQLCKIYKIPFTEIKLEFGEILTHHHLNQYSNKGYTGFIVNIHETSTGVLYDIDLISNFCLSNKMILVVDAISSFLSDKIDMENNNIDVLIIGSQKALACPPGVSSIIMSDRVVKKIRGNDIKCLYLNLNNALDNAQRGQTPFTPAVSILLQINKRLKMIKENGGIEKEIIKVNSIAQDFRNRIKNLPFEITSKSLSNTVTPLHCKTKSAYDIFKILKDEYNIWICPNGGELKDKIFRVGHIGNLTISDNIVLVDAFEDLQDRGII